MWGNSCVSPLTLNPNNGWDDQLYASAALPFISGSPWYALQSREAGTGALDERKNPGTRRESNPGLPSP